MARIFASLAFGNLVVLLLAAGFGIAGSESSAQRHVPLAVFALLVSCGVQVAAVTYLSVTSKILAQAVHLGSLDVRPLEQIRRHKRATMHALGLVVFGIVAMTATGAVNWRGNQLHQWHFWASCAGLLLHLVALYRQYGIIVANGVLVQETLEAYAGSIGAAARTVHSRDVTGERTNIGDD